VADAFAAADEIAGGGDGEADQRNIGVARLAWGLADIAKFEFDPPGLTVRFTPSPTNSPPISIRKLGMPRARRREAQRSTAWPLAMEERSRATPPGWKARRLAASTSMSRQLPDPHG